MDLQTAFEILGLPPAASFEEVKERYWTLAKQFHPDTSHTRDARQFVLLTTAYSLILDQKQGQQQQPTVAANKVDEADIASELVIQRHVQDRFDQLKQDFQAFFDHKVQRARQHISTLIDSAGSGSSLKDIVQNSVARVWIEMVKEIENYLLKLCELATTEDADFLYALFRDLYAEQRRLWVATLYRNPTVLFCVASFLLLCAAPAYPQLAPLAATFRLETMPWVTFAPLMAAWCFVVVKLRQLNPQHQFLPPRLSAFEVQAQTQAIANRLGQDRGEAMATGIAAGALLGSVVPGLGTLIGAGIGGIVGAVSGKPLTDLKAEAQIQIDTDMRLGLEQLHDRLQAWIEKERVQYTNAATESFARNIKKVARFLQHHTNAARQIAVESKLLLPAPETPAKSIRTTQLTERSELSIPVKTRSHPMTDQGVVRRWPHVLSILGNCSLALLIGGGVWTAFHRYSTRPRSSLLDIPPILSGAIPDEGTLVVVTGDTNLRGGPGKDFAVVGQARQGETFSLKGKKGSWYKISAEGQERWVHKSTVQEKSRETNVLHR